MNITWFGQSCFRFEAKEGSILIDPFSRDIGLRPPRTKDDVVLVSHEHYDHNNLDGLAEDTSVFRGPGEYEAKGMAMTGVLSYHDDTKGTERGLNTIFVIRAEDMTLCHLGDLGQAQLTADQIEAIGDVDILMVPVGGTFTLDGKTAAALVQQIEPKVVIPMHYKIAGLSVALDGPEKFVRELGLEPEKTDKLKIAAKTLPVEETKLYVLQP